MESSEEGKPLTFRAWHQELELLLVNQGIKGARQSAIVKHFKDVHPEEVAGFLELLLKEDKVQKFIYSRHIYWRATTEILSEAYKREG
jgi:hypothetical protein